MVSFSVILEKKGRGNRVITMINLKWSIRTFQLNGQQLKYYEGEHEKGSIDIKGALVYEITSNEADGKQYAFVIETVSTLTKEKIYLNASNNETRQKCINILNISSQNANWDQVEIGRLNAVNTERSSLFTDGLAELQLQAAKEKKEASLLASSSSTFGGRKSRTEKEKITSSSLQGLRAKTRFRKALEGGLLEPLLNAAVEMIQYLWLCKLARMKLEHYRQQKNSRYAIIIQCFIRRRIATRTAVRVRYFKKSVRIVQSIMRSFLAIKKVRKLMLQYPDLILIKVKSVYERDSEYMNNSDHDTEYTTLLKESIGIVSGISMKKHNHHHHHHLLNISKGSSSSSSSSSSSGSSNNKNDSSISLGSFMQLIRSYGVVTSSCRNVNPIYANNGFNIVASSTLLDGASITLVSRKQNEFLGQSVIDLNKLHFSSGKLFPDLVSPITSISIPNNELNKISNKQALIIKPQQHYSGSICYSIIRPLQSYNICGHLWKASGNMLHLNEWRKRFFILYDQQLQYYNNENNLEKLKYSLYCKDIISVNYEKIEFHGRKAIKILHTKGIWYLSFEENLIDKIKEKWMRVLQNNCK